MVNLIIHRSVLRGRSCRRRAGPQSRRRRRQITAAPQELFLNKH